MTDAPAFVPYLVARGLVSLASTMLTVALGWHLYQATGNALDLAFVGLMQILPIYLFFFASGWVVDRVPRDRLVRWCAVADMAIYSGIAWVMTRPELNTHTLFALVFAQGSVRAFSSPALQAVLPNLVPKAFLDRAVAMASTTWNLAMTAGPVIAGLLIGWLDRDVYWALVVAMLIAVMAYQAFPSMRLEKTSGRGVDQVMAGLKYVFANPVILGSLSLDLLIVGLGSVIVLLPIFATDILQVGPEGLGLLRAMPAFGAVLMGLYMARKKADLRDAGRKLKWALLVFSAAVGVFAVSELLWLSLLALFVYGASDMISVNIRMTLVQIATPDALRGRVSAVNSLFIASSNEAGDVRGGTLAAAVGPVATAGFGAVAGIAITLWGLWKFPTLFTLDRPKDIETGA